MNPKHSREIAFILGQLPPFVVRLMKEYGAFVAGGAVASVFSSQPIRDFDVFFPSAASLGLGLLAPCESEKVIDTDSARSLLIGDRRVQLVKVVVGDASTVINKFDFTICQAAFHFDQSFRFLLGDQFLQHLAQRRLVFNISAEYPICSLYRARKFLKRGFSLSGIEAIKLGLRIHSLKIDTYADLRKQLMGIDTLFLKDLTDSLKGKEEKDYDLNEFLATLEDWLLKLDAITDSMEEESR